MGRFDFERFNGFVRGSLDNLLFEDFWNLDIFNGRDMHAAAYFYIRGYCRKAGRIARRLQLRMVSLLPARQRSSACQKDACGDEDDANPICFVWPLPEERYCKQCRQRRHQSSKGRAP